MGSLEGAELYLDKNRMMCHSMLVYQPPSPFHAGGVHIMRKHAEPKEPESIRHCRYKVAAILGTAALLLGAPSIAQDSTGQPEPKPTVVVQIQFVPGGRGPWLDAFETHITPAIQAAIENGQLSDFTYYEAVVPGQSYDLMLILNADSFAFFDHRRPFPHYVALFQRIGVDEGRRILSEMLQWEANVSVSLLRAYGGDR